MASQNFTVKLSKKYDENMRKAIGIEIIDHILKRTKKDSLDKKNKAFAPYSKGYKDSFDFKLAGKSNKVNLTLSGEMLNAIEVLDASIDGEITIGIPENDTFNNDKALGHISGQYGKNKGVKRDFMGIHKSNLNEIKKKYPVKTKADREKSSNRLLKLLATEEIASELAENI